MLLFETRVSVGPKPPLYPRHPSLVTLIVGHEERGEIQGLQGSGSVRSLRVSRIPRQQPEGVKTVQKA